MVNKTLLLFLIILLGFVSCVERPDFDQLDDLRVTPTIESSILYVESPEDLLNKSTDSIFYSQNFSFDGFSEDVFADRVLEGVISYELENTTSKELEIIIGFLDENGSLLDVEKFHMDPAPTIPLKRDVEYGGGSGKSLEIIKNTSSIGFNITNMGDHTSISNLPDPKIIFRSSGKFRMRIR
ncbi:hypothetical protein [Arenibacter certesii]|uniref:Lipoprotein n=1 Tax=Arenibacter certesii TaxID=228955 RepID=A0A918INM5_9FLAO|nr:hypothetical protein [Arenibacter certesii]GGW23908.1 hypothetical protein GCM10007383_05450 [Arenibacter certesii]